MDSPHNANLRLHRRNLPALITTCTANRERLFENPNCAALVLESMRWFDAQRRMILYAAVVMPDHIHFVADPLESPWASHLLVLKSHTGREINRRLQRSGAVWQKQYQYRQVLSDEHLVMAIRYCELNPVRAGLVRELDRYPFFWSRRV